jgi:23S rRNA (cytosine1962-C5)-methyltransferase
MMTLATLFLKTGREKSVLHRHPWIFSGAIDRVEGNPAAGETVQVASSNGEVLATAAFSPASQIRARVWSWNVDQSIDAAFFKQAIHQAMARRASLPADGGRRLVHGESDGLPGIIVDQYRDCVVIQLLSAGAEHWRETLLATIREATECATIYERSDADVRSLEALPPINALRVGTLPKGLAIVENGVRFRVDVETGHKTGFYLDQRDNRQRFGQQIEALAGPRRVLNCFCYTGGFSLFALRAGAEVLSIDSSAEAIGLARSNAAANGLDGAKARYREADVFTELRTLRDRGERFDFIILDPPKFAPTERHVEKAARAYKDINLLALKMLEPGGMLATFSCSGAISSELFRKIVAGAAMDAKAEARVVAPLMAAADHPVTLAFPEGEYLKGLWVQKLA